MNDYVVSIENKEYRAEVVDLTPELAVIVINGKEYRVKLKQLGRGFLQPVAVVRPPATTETPKPAPAAGPAKPVAVASSSETSNVVKSPLPGLIIDVKVREGESVKTGQTIIIMEAMKMENQIQATCDGTIHKIFVKKSDNVAEGTNLAEINRSAMATL